MPTEKLTLKYREILDRRLKNSVNGLSDYSFANLYLFREMFKNELILEGEEIFVRGKTYDGHTHLMLTRSPEHLDKEYLKNMMSLADFIYPVPEKWLEHFPESEFRAVFDEAESDYIYEVARMTDYSGRRLHKKRNLLNQFLSGYERRVFPLVREHFPAAFEVLDAWQEESMQNKEETDYYPCREGVELSDELVLCGMIYYVGKEPAGFVLGEELTPEIFDIKFAKAKKKFKGIYQYLFSDFAGLLPKKYLYFNFEEDLGQPGLRKAKSSYQPAKKLVKYRVKKIADSV